MNQSIDRHVDRQSHSAEIRRDLPALSTLKSNVRFRKTLGRLDKAAYPLPWDSLEYDTKLDGYKMKSLSRGDLDKDEAPSFGRNEEPNWSEDYDRKIRLFYIRTA